MPRKAIFSNGLRRITISMPVDVYEWVKKKAEKERIAISTIIWKCLYDAMRRETGGG